MTTNHVPRNKFVDPRTGDEYEWHNNHDEEEESGRSRNISATANTGNVGLVRQAGDMDPFTLKWSGKILRRAQHDALWSWFKLCEHQTIYLGDFDGQEYEVQIVDLRTKRHRGEVVSQSGLNHHYWTYTIEFHVFAFLDGDMRDLSMPV